jgi:hypothetical protein
MRGLLFDPEVGGDMFLRNVCVLSSDYLAIYPRRFVVEVLKNIKLLFKKDLRFLR